jgi:hypothetical protein
MSSIRLFLLLPLCLIQFVAPVDTLSAQSPCGDQSIMDQKGAWNKRNDANMSGGKDQAAILRRLDQISELFKAAYPDPKGIQPNWYRTMGDNTLVRDGPIPYNFNSLYLSWYCNTNLKKIMLSDETGTWAYVFVNNFGFFLSDQYDRLHLKVNGNAVYVLPAKKGEWKGYPLYQASPYPGKSQCILVTRNNQPPWQPISQQQYLDALRQQWEEQRSKISSSPPMTKYLDDKIAVLDNYQKHSDPSTLRSPAILNRNMVEEFKGQFSTELAGGLQLVTVDPGYFNSKLPAYVPQLMVLLWRWDKSVPAQDFKKTFEANFAPDQLKNMLDK